MGNLINQVYLGRIVLIQINNHLLSKIVFLKISIQTIKNKALIQRKLWMSHLTWLLIQEINSLIKVYNKITVILHKEQMLIQ